MVDPLSKKLIRQVSSRWLCCAKNASGQQRQAGKPSTLNKRKRNINVPSQRIALSRFPWEPIARLPAVLSQTGKNARAWIDRANAGQAAE
jgi:hypothetical protein